MSETDSAVATATVRSPRVAATNSEFTELARRIKQSGLMRRRYGYYWTKLGAVPVAFAVTIVAFVWIGDSWWQMFTAAGSRSCSPRPPSSATTRRHPARLDQRRPMTPRDARLRRVTPGSDV